jgi:hypothetical protein
MEFSKLNVYLWQVNPMPCDPLYSKMRVEEDYQLAIDKTHLTSFIAKIEGYKEDGIECIKLPKGQPHSCDDSSKTWGTPRVKFNKLIIKKAINDNNVPITRIKERGQLEIEISSLQIEAFIKVIQDAASARVFFEYNHYIEVMDEEGVFRKINIWGWCQDGEIEFAN